MISIVDIGDWDFRNSWVNCKIFLYIFIFSLEYFVSSFVHDLFPWAGSRKVNCLLRVSYRQVTFLKSQFTFTWFGPKYKQVNYTSSMCLRTLQNQQKCLAVGENILNKYYMHFTLLIYCLFLLLSRNCITKLKIRSNSKSLFRNKRFVLDVMFHKNEFNFAICLEY